jgi:integrase
MAYVVKDSRGRSPYWIACYADSSGRRLKKSTKLTNKKDALNVALAWEHGEHLARKGAFSETRLREILEETLARVIGGPVEHYTAEAWLNWWQEKNAKRWSKATAERYRQVARDFVSSLGDRANLPIEHIRDADVLRYRDAAIADGVSNKTANLAVKIVSMAFNDALRHQKIKFNPCIGLGGLDETQADREPFSEDEIKRLRQCASGDWPLAILFAARTGARLGDVANMRWSAIDWNKRLISFTPQKTRRKKKALVIPLAGDLEKELLQRAGVGDAPIFPTLAGRKTGGAHALSAEFKAIMLQAGIRGKIIQHNKNGRRNETKGFHSLRHSFNSALANAGVSREVRQVLTGHASERMNEIYTHRELETLRSAVAVLPGL